MRFASLIGLIAFLLPTTLASTCSLLDTTRTLTLFVDPIEKPVVNTTLGLYITDAQSVSPSQKFVLSNVNAAVADIVAGTVATSSVAALLTAAAVKTTDIAGQWEAYKILCLAGKSGTQVVVVGSDPRGAAYGVLALSRMIGVGPWAWWADVTPTALTTYTLPLGYVSTQASPTVQYRGIFLNDEDFALRLWSSMIYEPGNGAGTIGPHTYSRIFELLLRLRANTIWPAMHAGTTPFFSVPGTVAAAARYGIVVGTSHAEPMLSNPAAEWNATARGSYNWITNKAAVVEFWQERLDLVKGVDVLITTGMRGVGDSPMQGVSGNTAVANALTSVISTQRTMLAIAYPATQPQEIFVPYKEVLDVYDSGLAVPTNISLVWCDDNYGYMTRLSNSTEELRSGGGGVYYHLSYWGRPHDYLWLASIHPSLIYYQMRRAANYNAKKFWVLNVGDIKPAEYLEEFYMDLAYSITSFTSSSTAVGNHLTAWATREFGSSLGPQVAAVMARYYQLANSRKPEHMGWSQGEFEEGTAIACLGLINSLFLKVEAGPLAKTSTPVQDTELNPFLFGDELSARVSAYTTLLNTVNTLASSIPTNKQDAFYQLCQYPVTGAALMNQKQLHAQKARLLASFNISSANDFAAASTAAYTAIGTATTHYDTGLASGKWNRMMTSSPRSLLVFAAPTLPAAVTTNSSVVVWFENANAPSPSGTTITFPSFSKQVNNTFFLAVYTTQSISYSLASKPAWLVATLLPGLVSTEHKIQLSVDWTHVTVNQTLTTTLTVNSHTYPLVMSVRTFGSTGQAYESNSIVAFNAANYTTAAGVEIIPGLGHSLSSVVLPPTTTSFLQYTIVTASTGVANITTLVMPNQPIALNGDIRLSVAVDGGTPTVMSFDTAYRSEAWKVWVLRGQATVSFNHTFATAGPHTLTVRALDEGVVVDQMIVDFKTGRNFYMAPVPGRLW
ncbi:hypothetical protein HKX48_008760 [Thoreauomyces humboldtii]|nr:hypothetical protein HKX48_008760 [Thoreauomyces humboldtii]